MPVGKDSIRKRVIQTEVAPTSIPPHEQDVPQNHASASANVPASASANAEASTPAPAKRPGRPRKTTSAVPSAVDAPVKTAEMASIPTADTPIPTAPATAVVSNISPEVVEKVVGHAESKDVEHVQITDDMPHYLL